VAKLPVHAVGDIVICWRQPRCACLRTSCARPVYADRAEALSSCSQLAIKPPCTACCNDRVARKNNVVSTDLSCGCGHGGCRGCRPSPS
jgi:hypothetical protein